MKVEGTHALTSVKGTPFRHPVAIALGATSLAILVSFNAAAFVLGLQAPWLLGGVLIGDMLVVGVGIVVAAREVLRTERRSEASEAQLAAIVDSAMDAIISVDEAQTVVLFNRAAETIFRCPRHEALGMRLER